VIRVLKVMGRRRNYTGLEERVTGKRSGFPRGQVKASREILAILI